MRCYPQLLCLSAEISTKATTLTKNLTDSGRPPRKAPRRAWLALQTLLPSTLPTIRSPTAAGSTFVRSRVALITVARSVSAGVSLRPPFLALVMGVRKALTMTTSSGESGSP